MIRMLTGTVVSAHAPVFVVDVNGVGYEVLSTTLTARVGDAGSISIYTVVKEDSLTLYGFNNEEERGLFALFLGVSGIGPKSALAILGQLSGAEITAALKNGDATPFTKVKGIGKKAAERLVVDLSGTLNRAVTDETSALGLAAALHNLGFTRREYESLLPDAPAGAIEAQLTWALAQLAR